MQCKSKTCPTTLPSPTSVLAALCFPATSCSFPSLSSSPRSGRRSSKHVRVASLQRGPACLAKLETRDCQWAHRTTSYPLCLALRLILYAVSTRSRLSTLYTNASLHRNPSYAQKANRSVAPTTVARTIGRKRFEEEVAPLVDPAALAAASPPLTSDDVEGTSVGAAVTKTMWVLVDLMARVEEVVTPLTTTTTTLDSVTTLMLGEPVSSTPFEMMTLSMLSLLVGEGVVVVAVVINPEASEFDPFVSAPLSDTVAGSASFGFIGLEPVEEDNVEELDSSLCLEVEDDDGAPAPLVAAEEDATVFCEGSDGGSDDAGPSLVAFVTTTQDPHDPRETAPRFTHRQQASRDHGLSCVREGYSRAEQWPSAHGTSTEIRGGNGTAATRPSSHFAPDGRPAATITAAAGLGPFRETRS